MSSDSDRALPRYSVVITAHNAADTIGPCLESIARQEGIAPGELETVLVDDRSSDGTGDAAAAAAIEGLRVLRIDAKPSGEFTARQVALDLGFHSVRGEIVLTLDADGVADPGWVRAMADPIEKGACAATAGSVVFRSASGWLGALQTVDVCYYLTVCRLLNALGMNGGALFGSFAFRGSLYEEVGGFPAIGFALTEDLAFLRAIRGLKKRVSYKGKPAVCLRACRNWRELVRRGKRVGAGGFSALAVGLSAWMLLLPGLGIAALAGVPFAGLLLAIRWMAGVGLTLVSLAVAGRFRLAPWALCYEPAAILIGVCVLGQLVKDGSIEWGGIRYAR